MNQKHPISTYHFQVQFQSLLTPTSLSEVTTQRMRRILAFSKRRLHICLLGSSSLNETIIPGMTRTYISVLSIAQSFRLLIIRLGPSQIIAGSVDINDGICRGRVTDESIRGGGDVFTVETVVHWRFVPPDVPGWRAAKAMALKRRVVRSNIVGGG